MFRVGSLDIAKKKEITIYPFKDEISRINSSSSNKVIIDTTRKERIVAKNLNIYRIRINALYTAYYNRNYRNN
ncbi:MAG: hypothetical protein V7719_05735 [Psychroserpens sp.]|uniref:hypothetical protein n=1 Tax=Psychroserpens sp. TaxID=2020870 RepID=UPI00300183D2